MQVTDTNVNIWKFLFFIFYPIFLRRLTDFYFLPC